MKDKKIGVVCCLPYILYFIMYIPVWNGRHLPLYRNGFVITSFVLMALSLFISFIGVFYCFVESEDKPRFMRYCYYCSYMLAIPAFVFFLFALFFFVLNLFGIPPIPPQS